jgi:hypothetical protein
MDLVEVGWGDVDSQDRERALVNLILNLLGSINCWETIEYPNN